MHNHSCKTMNSYLRYGILALLVGSPATAVTKKNKQHTNKQETHQRQTYTYPTWQSLDTVIESEERQPYRQAVIRATDEKTQPEQATNENAQTHPYRVSKAKTQARKIVAAAETNPYIDAFGHVGYVFYKGIDNFVHAVFGKGQTDQGPIVIRPRVRSEDYQQIPFNSDQAEEFFNDINGNFKEDLLYQDKPIMQNYALTIENEASKAGIPQLLVYAIIANESNGNPGIVSNKGAVGLMQVMPSTVALYTSDNVDLTDPQTNIYWGVRIYRDLLVQYGNPLLALAAYNTGTATIDDFISNNPQPSERQVNSFIRSSLSQDTQDYLDNVLGYCTKYLSENP
jgi:soluble lytic murein transglycosylase-like protein